MKRTFVLWVTLIVTYAALLAWHQPLRGPLSEEEVREAFGAQFTLMQQQEDWQAQAFVDFFLNDDGRPFFMVNLDSLPESSPEVETAAREYGLYMMGQLLPRASYPVLSTNVIVGLANSLETDLVWFERLVVVRYRSRRDFLEIIANPAFRDELENKVASLDGWYSAPSTIGPMFSLPAAAFCLLMTIGLIGTWWTRRPKRARRSRTSFDPASRA